LHIIIYNVYCVCMFFVFLQLIYCTNLWICKPYKFVNVNHSKTPIINNNITSARTYRSVLVNFILQVVVMIWSGYKDDCLCCYTFRILCYNIHFNLKFVRFSCEHIPREWCLTNDRDKGAASEFSQGCVDSTVLLS